MKLNFSGRLCCVGVLSFVFCSAITSITLAQTYAPPTGGWAYTFAGNDTVASDDPFLSLDGTWDHDNGSDEWDGSAIGEGSPGGVSSLMDGDNGYIRIQDSGDPRDYDMPDPSNRKVYLTHTLMSDFEEGAAPDNLNSIIDDGVTLYFRTRVATAATGPVDALHADGGGGIVDWPAEGQGYSQHNSGKSMIAIKQTDGANVAFGLDYGANVNSELFSDNGLILPHRLLGETLAGDGADIGLTDNDQDADPDKNPLDFIANEEGHIVPVDDITQWQEFWVTIESGSILVDPNFDERDGTHAVNVYSGSSDTPVDATPFVITAAKGSDFGGGGAEESYIAIGAGATGRAGAFDVDFFSWAPGVHVPELMGVETMCAPLNTLAGDLDGDEEVGFSDFLLLSGTFGGSAPDGVNPYTVGDIDCSGGVDFADFLTLSGNFGMKLGGAQSVPEPAGAMIWLTGALLLLTRRKNRV